MIWCANPCKRTAHFIKVISVINTMSYILSITRYHLSLICLQPSSGVSHKFNSLLEFLEATTINHCSLYYSVEHSQSYVNPFSAVIDFWRQNPMPKSFKLTRTGNNNYLYWSIQDVEPKNRYLNDTDITAWDWTIYDVLKTNKPLSIVFIKRFSAQRILYDHIDLRRHQLHIDNDPAYHEARGLPYCSSPVILYRGNPGRSSLLPSACESLVHWISPILELMFTWQSRITVWPFSIVLSSGSLMNTMPITVTNTLITTYYKIYNTYYIAKWAPCHHCEKHIDYNILQDIQHLSYR